SKYQQPSGGLVGAIEAREREKKEIKDGVSGQMVAHAIAQRQAQGAHHGGQYPSPQVAGPQSYARSPSLYGPQIGQFPAPPQQVWSSSQTQFYTQGGGQSSPGQNQYPLQQGQYGHPGQQ